MNAASFYALLLLTLPNRSMRKPWQTAEQIRSSRLTHSRPGVGYGVDTFQMVDEKAHLGRHMPIPRVRTCRRLAARLIT